MRLTQSEAERVGQSEDFGRHAALGTVNVAKEGGVEIVLSDATMHELGAEPITRPLGLATVRGMARPVGVYTIDQPQVRSAGGSDGNGNHDGGDARLPATQALRR